MEIQYKNNIHMISMEPADSEQPWTWTWYGATSCFTLLQ